MRVSLSLLVVAHVLAGTIVMAQGVWSQLGVTEANARMFADQVLTGGLNHTRTYDPIVLTMKDDRQH